MSDSVTTQINALTGIQTSEQSGSAEDWEKKYKELERKYHTERVEEGRLKKTNEELEALRKKLAEYESARRHDDLLANLTEEERSEIPDEVLNAATKLVNSGLGRMQEENDRRFKELEARNNANREEERNMRSQTFLNRIDERFPGLRSSITVGGDKADAWKEYLKYNSASISSAFQNDDFETFAYHVEKFFTNHLGIPVPSGNQNGSAASDPRASGGGNRGVSSVSGKTYTAHEFMELYDLVEQARDRGDYAEVNRLNSEIQKAPAEGRVKQA